VFVASCDRDGACHASFQSGPPGFVRILDETTLMYPVYEAGGDDVGDSRRVGLLFFQSGLTLHVDGRTRIIEHGAVEAFAPLLRRVAGMERFDDVVDGRRRTPPRWVLVDVIAARISPIAGVHGFPGPAENAPRPAQVAAATAPAGDDDELSYLLPPAWQGV
jgi:uncharacterized protein